MESMEIFRKVDRFWDGRNAIEAMRKANYNWRQMEWIGFYFQLLVKQASNGTKLKMPGRRFESGDFDAEFDGYDLDLKAHSVTDLNGRPKTDCILNDAATIDLALFDREKIFVAIAEGKAQYDIDGSFQRWHESVKGEMSSFTAQRISEGRPSRIRKSSFKVDSINVYEISAQSELKIMRQGRNSNGRPRPIKYVLDTSRIAPIVRFES